MCIPLTREQVNIIHCTLLCIMVHISILFMYNFLQASAYFVHLIKYNICLFWFLLFQLWTLKEQDWPVQTDTLMHKHTFVCLARCSDLGGDAAGACAAACPSGTSLLSPLESHLLLCPLCLLQLLQTSWRKVFELWSLWSWGDGLLETRGTKERAPTWMVIFLTGKILSWKLKCFVT